MKSSRFLIAGASSGSGKTTVTLGIISALRKRGVEVSSFKCGPDYIDAGFHTKASGKPAINLDAWMMGEDGVKSAFRKHSEKSRCSIIEGVMGLFDGVSADSDFGSSAHVAELLDIPVILVIDASGMARSIAATVLGYKNFMPKLKIAGVIANLVGSENHARILEDALKSKMLPPLLGYLPKNKTIMLPERHLGLVPDIEMKQSDPFFENLASITEKQIDIDLLLEQTRVSAKRPFKNIEKVFTDTKVRIGIAKDKAFSFYYPENLSALENAGAELVNFSPLQDTKIPNVDMLYFGGGYPEMFASELEKNVSMRNSVKEFADNDGTIYAECGGLMYLSEELFDFSNQNYKMCNVLDAKTFMEKKLCRLGYREITTTENLLFGKAKTKIRGHEFHFSKVIPNRDIKNVYNISYPENRDFECVGYSNKNILASYIHLYWGHRKDIAENIVKWVEQK